MKLSNTTVTITVTVVIELLIKLLCFIFFWTLGVHPSWDAEESVELLIKTAVELIGVEEWLHDVIKRKK